MKLRFNGRQVIKHFKSNLIESYTNHIIPTKLVVEIPYDGYTLTLLPSSDCIVGNGLVSWGDGTVSDLNKSLIHKYSKAGTYIIEGSFILKPTATTSLKETLIMIEYLSNKQVNLSNGFSDFKKLRSINQKRCYLNVNSMSHTYTNCTNLKSKPICGPNVVNFDNAYHNCYNLTGRPVCGNKVIDMSRTYSNCHNITGSPACGPNVTTMTAAYFNCRNLTGSPACGPNVTYMNSTYQGCYKLTGSPVCGDNVVNMGSTYYNCRNLTGSPVCGDKVTNMGYTYWNCTNLTGQPVCGDNVINMYCAYTHCFNITGSPVCGDNVVSMELTYLNCRNLTGSPVCGPNVTIMADTYDNCRNLTGSPVCGDNVTDMSDTYYHCENLTGSPVCGDKVNNMNCTYSYCYNLTGSPVCGDKVVNMAYTYEDCYKLTGDPVCGPNVVNMQSAYRNCYNLTGPAIVGKNVTNIAFAYANSVNISRNAYIFSEVINNNVYAINACFIGKSDNKRLDIYVPKTNNIRGRLSTSAGSTSLLGKQTTWITVTSNPGTTYNTRFNTYIHEVDSVQRAYDENERLVVTYDSTNAGLLPEVTGVGFNTYQVIVNGIFHTNLCRSNNILTQVKFVSKKTLTKVHYMSNDITSLYDSFYNCQNLTGDPWCGPNVTDMRYAYQYCYNLTGSPACGDKVFDMMRAYCDCQNLTGSPACGPNVTNMSMAYFNCYNLTGSPACGDNVRDMYQTYYACYNLTGEPVCGNNVTNFSGTYYYCNNLTGQPVCGDKVYYMDTAYYNCQNLTGSPVCGNNVGTMSATYYNCVNLTGPAIAGPNVSNLKQTYTNCFNIGANAYFFGNVVSDVNRCFNNKINTKMLNLYVHLNTNTLNTCLCNNAKSLVGSSITWTNDMTNNSCYYNNAYNIYIYPVDNVYNKYDDNETVKPVLKFISYKVEEDEYPDLYINGSEEYYDYSTTSTQLTNGLYETSVFVNDPNITISRFGFYNLASVTKVTYIYNHINSLAGSFVGMGALTNVIPMEFMNNIEDMTAAYRLCSYSLADQPVCGPNVTSMAGTYEDCYNLTGQPVCGDKVISMVMTYNHCYNLTGYPVCGPNVTYMSETYNCCHNLTGQPVCGDLVTDMYYTYCECHNLTGEPVCGPNVTNMCVTYANCQNLIGQPVIGNNVTNVSSVYFNCRNLTGYPVCPPDVTDTYQMYRNCQNLTGNPVCGDKVRYMEQTYRDCNKLTGPMVIGPNVINCYWCYANCKNLDSNAFIYSTTLNNVRAVLANKDKTRAMNIFVVDGSTSLNTCKQTSDSYSLTGEYTTWTNDMATNRCYYNTTFNIYIYPVANESVVAQRHNEFNNLITEYVSANNAIRPIIDNGTYTDYNAVVTPTTYNSSLYKISLYRNNDTYNVSRIDFNNNNDLSEMHIISRSVTNMSHCFNDCSMLKKHPVCSPNVTDMSYAFDNCINLTGNPQCRGSVTNMIYAYYNCRNLTGEPVCGPNVVNMDFAYNNCINLTGEPACGDNVTSMVGAYGNCVNITGNCVCGLNVTNMSWAYHNCVNLTGPVLVERNVVNLSHAYENCYNIIYNTYLFSDKINDMSSAFKNKDNSKITNIFVPAVGYNTTHNTLNTCLCNNTSSIVGNNITWTNDMATNGRYYNTAYNIYIYPVDNARYTYYNHHAIIAYTAGDLVYPNITSSTSSNIITYKLRDDDCEIVIYKNNTNDNVSYIRFPSRAAVRDVHFLTPTLTDMSNSFAYTEFRGKAICGPNVTNMRNTYCLTSVSEPVCGDKVTDMAYTYHNCQSLIGQPVCGNNVTNMYYTYMNCVNLTGSPVCGPNVTDMTDTYWSCRNITGSPVCGPNVTNMTDTYEYCYNLTGSPVCGDKVTSMSATYDCCRNLTGNPVCGSNVTNMAYTYRNCENLTGSPVCGDKVTNMYRTYEYCNNLTGPAIVGPNVTNTSYTYDNCYNLSDSAFVLSNNIDDARGCFANINKRINIYVPDNSKTLNTFIETNRYGAITCHDTTWINNYATNKCYYNTYYNKYIYPVANVEEMKVLVDRGIISYTTSDTTIRPNIVGANGGYTESIKDNVVTILKNDRNDNISYIGFTSTTQASKIQSIKYLTPDIMNMNSSFRGANILTGSPVCGDNVTDMSNTFRDCQNLTGQPVCGDAVVNMANTYFYCKNLTGSPVCGDNVVNFTSAYELCQSMTGSPVCGDKVVNMSNAYRSCYNITGTAIAGPNVTDMDGTFYDCVNISSESFVISNKVTSAVQCFYGKDNSRLLNIYVPVNSITLDTFLNTDVNTSIIGSAITWSNNSDCYYNTKHNIYIYPVANVREMYYNKLGIITYITSDSDVGPNLITNMNGETVSYIPKKEVVEYNNNYQVTLYKHDTNVGDIGINFFETPSLRRLVNCTETIDSIVFSNCYNLTGSPVCGPKVTDMSYVYYNCFNITGSPVCGNNVTDMYCTYENCKNLTGSPVCGDNVSSMCSTYHNCRNLTGSPVCGNNVVDIRWAYANCYNLTGSPVCGPNVTDMYSTYIGCKNLTGKPVCGPNVINMYNAYRDCVNLTGSPVCGDKVVNMSNTYYNCYNLTGEPVCGDKVTNMSNCYCNCTNIRVGIIGPNVTNAAYAYCNCKQISNIYFFGNNVSNCGSCIGNFNNDRITNVYIHNNTSIINTITNRDYYSTALTGSLFKFINDFDVNKRYYNDEFNIYVYVVDNVYSTYEENEGVPGLISYYDTTDVNMRPIIDNGFINYSTIINGNSVTLVRNDLNYVVNNVNFSSKGSLTKIRSLTKELTNISGAFSSCYNLTGKAICGPNVTDMSCAYQNCINLITPICGNNVTNMSYSYQNCYSLTGSPVCGPNVTDMSYAYQNCYNITGRPACGDKVVNMYGAYSNCISLTGSPVCGPNVTDMSYAYYNCYNLTGDLVIGNNVVNIAYAYANCSGLNKPLYLFANNIVNATGCLYGKNNSVMLDIYLHANSNTCNTFLINNAQSLVGSPMTWTNDMTTNGRYYNTAYNIYIYPVDSVIIPVSYNVSNHSGADYGFYYDTTNNFWVSGNKGKDSTAALCNVRIENPTGRNVIFEYICNGESNYDYGLFSNVNKSLTTSSSNSSTNVFYNCYGTSSTALRTLNYGPVSGTIQVKYRKDSSYADGYDTIQFRVIFE